jgi:hypothetical protein
LIISDDDDVLTYDDYWRYLTDVDYGD